jgi:hypothetical protein
MNNGSVPHVHLSSDRIFRVEEMTMEGLRIHITWLIYTVNNVAPRLEPPYDSIAQQFLQEAIHQAEGERAERYRRIAELNREVRSRLERMMNRKG